MTRSPRFVHALLATVALVSGTTGLEAQERTFVIETLPGRLRYDVERIEVAPRTRVRLLFRNNDEMQHNLVLCRPGPDVTLSVARAAWALGADAVRRRFVPDHPDVIRATRVVDPGGEDSLVFEAPDAEADFPYVCTLPGHAFTMKGLLVVTRSPTEQPEAAAPPPVRPTLLEVTGEPRVKRAFVQDGPARAILVGLPGGINFCFDADACAVPFGWFGAFLDVGPDWGDHAGHRGGQPVRTLGERFPTGHIPLALRIGGVHLTPQVVFRGYDWPAGEPPTFHFLVDGALFSQKTTAAPDGIGLHHEFRTSNVHAPVHLLIDDRDVTVESPEGQWDGRRLVVPPDNAAHFTVTVRVRTQTHAAIPTVEP